MKETAILLFAVALTLPLKARADDVPNIDGVDHQALVEFAQNEAPAYNNALKTPYSSDPRKSGGCLNAPDQAACWNIILDEYKKHKSTAKIDTKKVADTASRVEGQTGSQTFDNNNNTTPLVTGKPGEGKEKEAKASKHPRKAGENIDDSKDDTPRRTNTVENGALTPTPAPAKDDPNKWNDTIAGAKTAIWAGIIGFILGGPAGLMVCALVGFGAGYFMHKM